MRLGVNRNHPFWHGRFGRRAQRAQASERLKHVAEAVPSPAVSCKSEASGFDLGGVVWQLVVDVSRCRCCRLELTSVVVIVVVKGWLMMMLGACANLVVRLEHLVSLAHITATLMHQFWFC
jgi:hypothetical protein